MSIFKRTNGDIDYYSSKGVDLPKKKLAALAELRADFGEDAYQDMLAKLNGQADNGDAMEHSFENLDAISARASLLAPMARETRTAQSEMAVALLNQSVSDVKAHVEKVKKATGESWPKIRMWCDEPAKGGPGTKKSGGIRVPADVVRAVDEKVAEGKQAAANRFGAKN